MGVSTEVTARLDRAVAAVDRTRRDLLAVPPTAASAATALDTADEACATGRLAAARPARRTARAALPEARRALRATGERATAYREALRGLGAAGRSLGARPSAALQAVVQAGDAEADAVEAFSARVGPAFAAYTALDAAQSTWVDRTAAGWYRSPAEAAGAYAVTVRSGRPALDRARATLAQADAARRPATERQRAALSAADRALDDLRLPG